MGVDALGVQKGQSMPDVAAYTQHIRRCYPEPEVDTATLNQAGQYNDVLIVNASLIFRFARVRAAIEALQHEVAILKCLQDLISLAIPYPIYEHLKTDVVGEAFVGYRMIPGRSLWRDEFQRIDSPQHLRRMATQLARFLYELHHVHIDCVVSLGVPRFDTREEWPRMYARIRAELFPLMQKDARRETAALFEGYLADPDAPYFEPRLRHGDFGTGNILFDPLERVITGIADFGHAELGDPAADFAGLSISFGEGFYQLCYATYPAMEDALDRVRFYEGTFALQEALFGLDNGDKAAFRSGMAEYV